MRIWKERVKQIHRKLMYTTMYVAYMFYSERTEEAADLRGRCMLIGNEAPYITDLKEIQEYARDFVSAVPGRTVNIYEKRMIYRWGTHNP